MKTQIQTNTLTRDKNGETIGIFILQKRNGKASFFMYLNNFDIHNLQDLLFDEANFIKYTEIEYLGEGVNESDVSIQSWSQTENCISFDLNTFEWDYEGDESDGTYHEWKVEKIKKYQISFSFVTKREFLNYARNFEIGSTKMHPDYFNKDVYYADKLFAGGLLHIPQCMA